MLAPMTREHEWISVTEAVEIIRDCIKKVGGVKIFSGKHDISEGHLRAVLANKVKPGKRTSKACSLLVSGDKWRIV